MPTNYFDLPRTAQKQFLEMGEVPLGQNRNLLEKDIWLCLTLRELFQLPHPMTFKGGTSLSKVFNLIRRFSEDVDVTLDYRQFATDLDLSKPISRTALKKTSENLRDAVRAYTHGTVLPHMLQAFEKHIPGKQPIITLSDDGEKMFIDYPSAFDDINTPNHSMYVKARVLVEFGGRNTTEPSQLHKVTATMSNFNRDIILPMANVNVLSPVRTFWEKATLIHVSSHKGRIDDTTNRLSRHWYDLAMLADTWILNDALSNKPLLENVIKHKLAFYYTSYAHYEDCLSGKFRLLPDSAALAGLKSDYENMIDAGMFEIAPPKFEMLITKIQSIQDTINQSIQSNHTTKNDGVNQAWLDNINKNEIDILCGSQGKALSQLGNLLKELRKDGAKKQNQQLLVMLITSVIKDPIQSKILKEITPDLYTKAQQFVSSIELGKKHVHHR